MNNVKLFNEQTDGQSDRRMTDLTNTVCPSHTHAKHTVLEC